MRIQLRQATLADAENLLAWRNDPVTLANSHNSEPVSMEQHLKWLSAVLSDPSRSLLIAVLEGQAVGTVRADASHKETELSWTVAPLHRGRGVGSAMVRKLAASVTGPVLAEVKESNAASVRVALAAGLELSAKHGEILVFRRLDR